MHRRVLLIAVAAAAIAVAVGAYLVRSAVPPPTTPAAAPAPVAPAPAVPREAARDVRPAPSRTPRPAAPRPERVEPPPTSATAGTLRVTSDVPGAQVFLDREFVGRAPAVAENVRPGSHRLNVEAEGLEGVARTIEVGPGVQDIEVRLREVRLDAAIDVVHKHRIGSCSGRLTATPAGLRYTTDSDDAFEVPLGALETFEVNYLDKNLRVKTKGGKQYNFTDRDGNADRLFVFHRDVDAARKRLASGDAPAAP